METFHCAPTARALAPLLELDERLARGEPAALLPRLPARMAPLLPSHPFGRHGEVITFGVRSGGEVVGRASAVIDRRLAPAVGGFGFLSTVDDATVVGALLDAVTSRLARCGIRRMIGPVEPTIWHGCRIQTGGPRRPRLSVEPGQPAYLERHLRATGLRPVRRFVTHRFAHFAVNADRARSAEERVAREGYRLRGLSPTDLSLELDHIHRIARMAFVDSLGYVPLSRAEFLPLFRPLAALVDPRMVVIGEAPSGEPCAFALSMPDPTAAIRATSRRLGWLRAPLALRRPRGMIYKTMAVMPGHRGRGLATGMAARAHTAGARLVGGSLFQGFFDEGNRRSIQASMSVLDVGQAEVRRYAILGTDI